MGVADSLMPLCGLTLPGTEGSARTVTSSKTRAVVCILRENVWKMIPNAEEDRPYFNFYPRA